MLQVTFNDADRILLDMADAAEAATQYRQESFGSGCGSPGCMLGTYGWKYPRSIVGQYLRDLITEEEFDRIVEVNDAEWTELFAIDGCGNAGTDGKAAAAYLRQFVRKRALARIER